MPEKFIYFIALRTRSLAESFSAGATASSKSKIIASAPMQLLFIIRFGVLPGTKSMDLRIVSLHSSAKCSFNSRANYTVERTAVNDLYFDI